jgi:hypothetical protein
MNRDRANESMSRQTVWAVGILGTFLVVAVLVALMIRVTRPEPVNGNRISERYQFLHEVRQAEVAALSQYSWQNKDKGIVRVPAERAMELVLHEWQNPTAARSNLIARVESATALPPKPPEAANPYE